MDARNQKRKEFVRNIGWNDATSVVVAGDASNRSYERLTKQDGKTAILMNAPPEKGEDVKPFIKILTHLRNNGLEAPALLDSDHENGFLLLEDLGDDLFARICQTKPEQEKHLYKAAIDVLLKLHSAPIPTDVPPYDLAVYLRETDLVTDWYLPSITGQVTSYALVKSYRAEITTACDAIQTPHSVLVLRDYHAENLLWLPERNSIKNVGLLDFQDALVGHPAYDLVSLLEDARRDTSKELQVSMKSYFIEKSRAAKDAFEYAYAAIGAQRNLKIIGIFARLCVRDAKSHYVDLIPRVWAHLQRDLNHPELVSLKNWVDAHVPEPTPEVLTQIKEAQNAA
jgi:aminoglycoside/choline kinase family phosphotransferase